MIFLKKFISAGILSAMTGAFLCGCTSGTHKIPSAPMFDETVTTPQVSQAEIQEQTQSDGTLIEQQDGAYIYDKIATLTNTEFDECNQYAKMLNERYLLNTAVVITDDLQGMEAEAYAAKVYNELFNGMGSGMVFLVNNATQSDILYKSGQCQRFIDEVSERDELYHATKELVVGNYKEAILIMLKLGEKCPMNVVDNTDMFSEEMAEEFSNSLDECANSVTLVATNNISEVSNEELARNYYDRRYANEAGYLVLMDKKSRSVTAVTQGELPAEIAEFVSAANQTAANNDFIGAANRIVSGFGGVPLTISVPDETETEYTEEDAENAEYTEYSDEEETE